MRISDNTYKSCQEIFALKILFDVQCHAKEKLFDFQIRKGDGRGFTNTL